MSKTLLAVNTLTAVGSQAYASHLTMAFRMGKDCPEDNFLLFNGYRTSIDRFRNMAGKIALEQECDYLFFVDDDVLCPSDTYKKLKERNVDIVTPVTYIRSYPFAPMFFQVVKSSTGETVGLNYYYDYQKAECENDLLPAAAIGFSCCLIKVELLKKIPPAWFITSPEQTEDVYFCVKARQYLNNQVGIYVDRSFAVGHMLDPEFVHPKTVAALRNFYEELDPDCIKKYERGDRSGTEYLDLQRARLDKMEFQIAELEENNRKVAEGA